MTSYDQQAENAKAPLSSPFGRTRKADKYFSWHFVFSNGTWKDAYGRGLWIVSLLTLAILAASALTWHFLVYFAGAFQSDVLSEHGVIFTTFISAIGFFCLLFFVLYLIGVHRENIKSSKSKSVGRHENGSLFHYTSANHSTLISFTIIVMLLVLFIVAFQSGIHLGTWANEGFTQEYNVLFFNDTTAEARPFTDFPDEADTLSAFDRTSCETTVMTVVGNDTVNTTVDTMETIGASTTVNTYHLISSHTIILIFLAFTAIIVLLVPEIRIKADLTTDVSVKPRAGKALAYKEDEGGLWRVKRHVGSVDWSIRGYWILDIVFIAIHLTFWLFDIFAVSGWWSSGQAANFFWDRPWLMFVLRISVCMGVTFLMLMMVLGMYTRDSVEDSTSPVHRAHYVICLTWIASFLLVLSVLNLGWLWTRVGPDYISGSPVELICRIQPDFRAYNAFKVLQITFGSILFIPLVHCLISTLGREAGVTLVTSVKD